ncbi:MAG: chorismate synthase [Eubacteriales bacterium]|nr:chorismate synthase [Eubacteriales bacterium]
MLRFFTAGETHGPCLTAIVEGMPSGVKIDIDKINAELKRRQAGYGRGGRMKIESDRAEILSGVRGGYTLGSPITIRIENRDWKNWQDIMGAEFSNGEKSVTCPRPGHADLSGGMKYNHRDLRNVLERASARETAARVAVGALVRQLTEQFGIDLKSRVVRIGEIEDKPDVLDKKFYERVYASEVGFGDAKAEMECKAYIDKIKEQGRTVGGVVETVVTGLVPGIGSYVQYDRKLDAKIAFAVMSIQAIKGVEFGMGFEVGEVDGGKVQDEIVYNDGYARATNNAGGIEGGMTNGEPVIVRAAMKPIPTQYSPLKTVDITNRTETAASVERSDICAVPACAAVVESAVAFEIANAFLEKFGGDCIEDIKASYDAYVTRINNF